MPPSEPGVDPRQAQWDGGSLPGLRRLTETDVIGTPGWLAEHVAPHLPAAGTGSAGQAAPHAVASVAALPPGQWNGHSGEVLG